MIFNNLKNKNYSSHVFIEVSRAYYEYIFNKFSTFISMYNNLK